MSVKRKANKKQKSEVYLMDDLERFKRIISKDTIYNLLEMYGLLFHYLYIGCQRTGDHYKMQVIENEIIKRTEGYNHEPNL